MKSPAVYIFYVSVAAILVVSPNLFGVGCQKNPQRGTNVQRSNQGISEQRARRIAEMECEKRCGVGQYNSIIHKRTNTGLWVYVEFIPSVPGGHFTVLVSNKGTILEFIPGA